MKLAIAWFTVLALFIVISCSVNHRSGDYACTKQSDCASPRICDPGGFCIVPDGVPIDGPPGVTDAKHPDGKLAVDASQICPAQCTSCDTTQHTCKIECGSANNNCVNEVVCPLGYNCTIGCNAPNSCRNGVVCTDATQCTIQCGGSNSCRNIQCGDGPCQVTCSGTSSCHNVDCANSCGCDVTCTGPVGTGGPTCQGVICTALSCSSGPGGCSSGNPGCANCF